LDSGSQGDRQSFGIAELTIVRQINFHKLAQWRKKGIKFVLIDVREPAEHEAGNIGGHLVPLSDLKSGHHLFIDAQPAVIYCKRGIRSQIAIQRLKNQFPSVKFYNLQGGIIDLSPEELLG